MTARDPVDTLLAYFATMLGPLVDVTRHSDPWASATFNGARYIMTFTVDANADVARFLAEIGEADIAVRGGFVADVAVVSVAVTDNGQRLSVEALTIDAV